MASPKFRISAYIGRDEKASHTTNSRAIADIMFDDFQGKYPRVAIHRLARIDQGVAVYDVLKAYDKGASNERTGA